MSNSSAGSESRTRVAPTKAVRLIHAAALAAVLVPLGSVAVETSVITCTSTAGGSSGAGCSGLRRLHREWFGRPEQHVEVL